MESRILMLTHSEMKWVMEPRMKMSMHSEKKLTMESPLVKAQLIEMRWHSVQVELVSPTE